MAYQNVNIVTDETMVNSYSRSLELGALMTAYAGNGKLVFQLQKKVLEMDITGAEGYLMSHNPEVEGEVAKCAIRIA
tara:strand:+ start:2980 stop:3210 length:231 start_codon:yes stop_codon:yes gene_type:complete